MPFHFTLRGMRRTYQDLAREADIHDVITRPISGHATVEMQHRYSTARQLEISTALAKISDLALGLQIVDLSAARAMVPDAGCPDDQRSSTCGAGEGIRTIESGTTIPATRT